MPRSPLDFEETGERFRRRERVPKGRRAAQDLWRDDDAGEATGDPSIAGLRARGLVTEFLGELKSGKEATVYLVRTPTEVHAAGLAALKLYKDLRTRSFKDDRVYREGRYIGDARVEKAIDQRSATGVDAQQSLWVMHEYRELWTLWDAGVPVPKPLVGPGARECAEAGRAVLMAFVGTEEDAAPRLSDARLTPAEARDAWAQSVAILAALLRLGRAHGDYSTYNLLWWEGRVTVIDFPQVVSRAESRAFDDLLARDVRSLCQSFARHGLRPDPAATLREVQRLALTARS